MIQVEGDMTLTDALRVAHDTSPVGAGVEMYEHISVMQRALTTLAEHALTHPGEHPDDGPFTDSDHALITGMCIAQLATHHNVVMLLDDAGQYTSRFALTLHSLYEDEPGAIVILRVERE